MDSEHPAHSVKRSAADPTNSASRSSTVPAHSVERSTAEQGFSDHPSYPRRGIAIVGSFGDYLELTKPRVTSLVLVTTLVGFYMGSDTGLGNLLVIHAMLGTALVVGGASALN